MRNDNMITFIREISLERFTSSFFLFGPRMTGKTFLLKRINTDLYLDLLIPKIEIELRENPEIFWEMVSALPPGGCVVIDEVQKVPELLTYVHKAIEELGIRFILSGSSARKLKVVSADMLGGRALDLRLFPLTLKEVNRTINLEQVIHYGSLPKIVNLLSEGNTLEANMVLKAYYHIYLKEEIQVEALVRNLSSFQRFFPVAAQANAQVIEFQNISRECSVPASTVKEYFQILEDTHVGFFLWPWNRSERKKARPKFYFFDNGVLRSIQKRVGEKSTRDEQGMLFETWLINEMRRILSYESSNFELSLWREGHNEIDIVIEKGGKIFCGIEIKLGTNIRFESNMRAFCQKFPGVPLYIVSKETKVLRKLAPNVHIVGIYQALRRFRKSIR